MRVLHVTYRYLPYIGGAALRLSKLAEALATTEEIHILVPRREMCGDSTCPDDAPDEEIINGVVVHRVADYSVLRRSIRTLHKKYRFDLLHLHNSRLALVGLTARLGVPLVLEIHAPELNPSRIKRFGEAVVWKFVDHFIVLSKSMRRWLRESKNIPEAKISVVYNGVENQPRENVSVTLGIPAKLNLCGKKVVGYIGTLYDWQGVRELLGMFRILAAKRDDVMLLVVGDGPEREWVESEIQSPELRDRVRFVGAVPSRDVPRYIAAIDVMVVPRPSTLSTETAVPMKIFEAMMGGKPVVGTQVGGLTEVLEDGVDALLSPPGDIYQLADNVLRLLDDNALYTRIATAAYEKARQWPSWKESAECLHNVYKALVTARPMHRGV